VLKAKCATCSTSFWLKDMTEHVQDGKAARDQAEQRAAHESLNVKGQVISGVRKLFLNLE
jgi:hypothetical protein